MSQQGNAETPIPPEYVWQEIEACALEHSGVITKTDRLPKGIGRPNGIATDKVRYIVLAFASLHAANAFLKAARQLLIAWAQIDRDQVVIKTKEMTVKLNGRGPVAKAEKTFEDLLAVKRRHDEKTKKAEPAAESRKSKKG